MSLKQEALENLNKSLTLLEKLKRNTLKEAVFDLWQQRTTKALQRYFGEERIDTEEYVSTLGLLQFDFMEMTRLGASKEDKAVFETSCDYMVEVLKAYIEEIEDYWDESESDGDTIRESAIEVDTLRRSLQGIENRLALYETRLHDQLLDTFDVSELKSLCFALAIDYEILSGENKSDKARELILYCRRHNRTAELLERCRTLRPHLLW